MRLALLLAVATGCDSECIDGICPDTENATKHAGPCRAASNKHDLRGTFAYDAQGRLIGTTADAFYAGETGSSDAHWESTWTYEGEALAQIIVGGTTWKFLPTEVHELIGSDGSRIYDRSVFAWEILGHADLLSPRARLGLLNDNGNLITTTIDGNKRTQTRNNGGYIEEDVYTLDGNRIVSLTRDYNIHIGGIDEVQAFTYEGDRLIGRRIDFGYTDLPYVWTPTFDRGGNLVEEESVENDSTFRTVYDYGCW